jgi:hypothetical protein
MKAFLIVLAVLLGSILQAQTLGTISGTLLSPEGRPVAAAEVVVKLSSTGTERTGKTDAQGLFVIAGLEPGRYQFTARAVGYRDLELPTVELNVAGSLRLNLSLSAASATFSAEATATPTLIEKDLVAQTTVVRREFVENLPLNGRSFQTLIELAPGVALAKAGVASPGQFSVNGQRTNANMFLVDGVSGNVAASTAATFSQQAGGTLPGLTVLGGTNSLVTVDTLQEFRIQTSSFAPEFGRSPGGQVILLTRSGANRFHGSLFHEFRNEKLDANDWFANAAGQRRAPFRLNQFGGTFSGPLVKDRTFFFAAYEGLQLRQPLFQRVQVPSVSARARATGPIRDLLNAFPLPNSPSPFTNPDEGFYEAPYSDPARSNIFSLRMDHRFTAGLKLFGRMSLAPTEREGRVFANQKTSTFSRTNTYTVGLDWTINPRDVNELRVNYSTSRGGFDWDQDVFGGAVRLPDSLIFPSYTDRGRASAGVTLGLFLPGISPPNLTQGRSIGNNQRQWNFVDSLTLIRGRHQIKIGGDYRLLLPTPDFREFGITYGFGSITNAINTGAATVSVQSLAPVDGMRIDSLSLFAQDTWRIHPKLTLTYGLRWEIQPPPRGRGNRPIFGPTQVDNPFTMDIAPAGLPLWSARVDNFAPRFGLAWQFLPTWVFRVGGGLFHDLGLGQASRGFNSWPYNTNRQTTGVPFPASAAVLQPLPFNTQPPYSSEFFLTDPQLRQPYTVHWSAGIEKDFRHIGAIDIRYVANAGRLLLFNEQLRNRPATALLSATNVVNPVFGTASIVNISRNAASNDYHSLQVQFRRQATRSLQTQISYTWAKAIDTFSDETSVGVPLILNDRRRDRGPADFDIRHNLVAAVTWALPKFRNPIVRGWSLDSILRARTATPVNIVSGSDPLNLGATTLVRPDLVSGVPLYLDAPNVPGGRRINSVAFILPPNGRAGTLGRNALRSLPMTQFDLALRREFTLFERFTWQIRLDAFNLLNKANFGDPNVAAFSAGNPNPLFGLPTAMLNRNLGTATAGFNPLFQVGGPRSLQASIRLRF